MQSASYLYINVCMRARAYACDGAALGILPRALLTNLRRNEMIFETVQRTRADRCHMPGGTDHSIPSGSTSATYTTMFESNKHTRIPIGIACLTSTEQQAIVTVTMSLSTPEHRDTREIVLRELVCCRCVCSTVWVCLLYCAGTSAVLCRYDCCTLQVRLLYYV